MIGDTATGATCRVLDSFNLFHSVQSRVERVTAEIDMSM